MQVDFESSRARLAFLASVASAVRRMCGLEWRPRHGYRTLGVRRMERERRLRAPADVAIHVLRQDVKQGVAVVEWQDAKGRLRQAELPEIALARHARRRRGGKQALAPG
jgi:hypothetical protein